MLKDSLTESILERFPDVDQRTSRFSERPAFWLGRREIAHYHDGNEIDVRLTRKVIRRLKSELEADRRVQMRGSSDWVELRFPRRADLARVLELLELACEANR